MKIVICGFGSAGYAAAMSVKRTDPKAEIVVIDPKGSDLMHPCGLPYALEGIVKPDDLLQDINLQRGGIKRIRGKAVKLFTDKKEVQYLCDEGDKTENYDSLIIATGTGAVIPPVHGIRELLGKSVFTLTDTIDLRNILDAGKNAGRCAVIGGGAIGIEAAFAMKKSGKDVTLIEMREQLLPGILDPDISLLVENYFSSEGISVMKGSRVTDLKGDGCLSRVICGEKVAEADIAIVAAGFAPDITLAENSGIEFYDSGIKTDSYLRTSAQSVYAAGDCLSGWSSIDGKPVSSRLATSAYKQGTTAGLNAAGGEIEYRGTASTFVTRTGSFEVAGTGFNTEIASQRGFEPLSGKITSKIRPEYYPENSDITVKIIFDRNSGVILGAQCAGNEGAASRINIISMAVEFGITIDELWRTELAYCPSVSEVYDPLLRAADIGVRRLKR